MIKDIDKLLVKLQAKHKTKVRREITKLNNIKSGKIKGHDWFYDDNGAIDTAYINGEIERLQAQTLNLAMTWHPRLKLFKSGSNCNFNPFTGEGRSYNWYLLSKVFKKTLVLNTYRYSVTTSGHVRTLSRLLEQLGLKFVELEAPHGLQDLNQAKTWIVNSLVRAVIKNHYAKNKNKHYVNYWFKQIDVLRKIGVKINKTEINLILKITLKKEAERREENKLRGVRLRKEKKMLEQQALSLESVNLI